MSGLEFMRDKFCWIFLSALILDQSTFRWGFEVFAANPSVPIRIKEDVAIDFDPFDRLLLRAEEGDLASQLLLGWMYDRGEGAEQSDFLALKWFKRAAIQGETRAQAFIGARYLMGGKEVEVNYPKALYWLHRAAQKSNSDAEFNLGVVFLEGLGVIPSGSKAAYWFQRAALKNDSEAHARLGWMYLHGNGVPKSYSLARTHFQSSGLQNLPEIGEAMEWISIHETASFDLAGP